MAFCFSLQAEKCGPSYPFALCAKVSAAKRMIKGAATLTSFAL